MLYAPNKTNTKKRKQNRVYANVAIALGIVTVMLFGCLILTGQNYSSATGDLEENRNAQVTYNYEVGSYVQTVGNSYSADAGYRFVHVQIVLKNNSYSNGLSLSLAKPRLYGSDGNVYGYHVLGTSYDGGAEGIDDVTLGTGSARVFTLVYQVPTDVTASYIMPPSLNSNIYGYDSTLTLENQNDVQQYVSLTIDYTPTVYFDSSSGNYSISYTVNYADTNNITVVPYTLNVPTTVTVTTVDYSDTYPTFTFVYPNEVTYMAEVIEVTPTISYEIPAVSLVIPEGQLINPVYTISLVSSVYKNLDSNTYSASNPSSTATFSGLANAISDAKTDSNVSMSLTLGNSSIVFDNAALKTMEIQDPTADTSVSITPVGEVEKDNTVRNLVGYSPIYRILLDINNLGEGKATVTVPYTLESGRDANNLVVCYIADGKIVEKIPCTYNNGKVTFVTNHFSDYAVMYEESPAKAESPITFIVIGIGIGVLMSFSVMMLVQRGRR